MNQKWSKSGTKINRKQQNGHEKNTYKMKVNAFRNMYFKGHLGQADEFQVLQSFIHSKLKSLYSSILEQLTQGWPSSFWHWVQAVCSPRPQLVLHGLHSPHFMSHGWLLQGKELLFLPSVHSEQILFKMLHTLWNCIQNKPQINMIGYKSDIKWT